MTGPRTAPAPFWRAPLSARPWQEQGYLVAQLVTAPLGFAWFVLTVALIPSLAITVVGLFVGGGLVVGARWWGTMQRWLASRMLGREVPAPPPWRRPRGSFRTLGSMLGDVTGWRALGFMVAQFVLALIAFPVSITVLAVGLGGVTYWYWGQWLPAEQDADGVWHRGSQILPGVWIEGVGNLIAVAAGLALLLLWPLVTGAFARLFGVLAADLLGPTASAVRLAEVTRTRSQAVQDADGRLRQIERDLHDGTQARLVAISMQLGEARDALAAPGADPQALELVTQAHDSTKEAMVELREISRGIRPASLDAGLVLALETLAARGTVPVTVDADPDLHASPEIEAIAYYCVAELLTNVAKHAQASGAYVTLAADDGMLRIRVRDDGVGGSAVTSPGHEGGTGLAGLRQRLAAVDGVLGIDSPAGGPTVVDVTLPLTVDTER